MADIPKYSSNSEKAHSHSLGIPFEHSPAIQPVLIQWKGERRLRWQSYNYQNFVLFFWLKVILTFFRRLFFRSVYCFFSIIYKPDGIACLCKLEWYCSFFMILLTWVKSLVPSPSKHPHTIIDLPLCSTVGNTLEFLNITVFSAHSCSVTRVSWSLCTPWAPIKILL